MIFSIAEDSREFPKVRQNSELSPEVTCYLQCISIDQIHDNTMPIKVDWSRYGKAAVIQCFHVGEFSCGRDARQIQPRNLMPASVIVSLFLDVPKACPS